MLILTLFACTKTPADPTPADTGEPTTGDSVAPCDELTWYVDADGDGFGGLDTVSACEAPNGTTDVSGDCDDTNGAVHPDASEVCNGADDDCDGLLDDGDDSTDPATFSTWYADEDGDGYGDAAVEIQACDASDDRVADATDCDDAVAAIHPGADEVCNGLDDDCDDEADEDAIDAGTWYADLDEDTYGDAATTRLACDQPSGWVADATDCDDTREETFPGADELCNDEDDDCDGTTDEDDALDAPTWYADGDSDGYGDASNATVTCDQPTGMVSDDTDCDDGDADTNPAADEYCDGHDDDCDGDVDEAGALDTSLWFVDSDGDGYGDASTTQTACDQPSGYAATGGDCDDSDGDRSPGHAEICDGFDNDCDPSTSEDGMASIDTGSGWTDITSSVSGSSGSPATYAASTDGDLLFCDGTFYVNVAVTADVSITSESGDASAVLLDGGGVGPVVDISGGRDVWIESVTLQNGYGTRGFLSGGSYGGGGVSCAGDTTGLLELTDAVLDANDGGLGGALALDDCDAELTDVELTNNTATYGAAGFLIDSYVTLDGVTVSDGSATYAGAFYTYTWGGAGTTLDLVDTLVEDNSSTYYGAVFVTSSDLYCDATAFTGNDTTLYGSAISALSSTNTLTVSDCDFGTLSAGDDNDAQDIYWSSDYYEAGDGVTFDCATDCGTYTSDDVASGTTNAYYEAYGNVFLATEDATLHTWSAELYRSGCTATLFVAASASATTGYELEYVSSAQSLGSSIATVSAGTTDIAIEAGRYYALGATSSCDIYQRYSYVGGTDPDWGTKYGYLYSSAEVTGAVGDAPSFSVSSSTSIAFDHTYSFTILD